MRASDLFRQYRESINPPYTRKGFLLVFGTLLILLVLPTTTIAILGSRDLKGRAASKNPPEVNTISGTEFLSNEILIKLSPEAKRLIKPDPKPADTGITELNALNGKFKVKEFKELVKAKKEEKPDHPIFSWYKVVLEGEGKVIRGDIFDVGKRNIVEGRFNQAEVNLLRALDSYKRTSQVVAAEPNYIFRTSATPNDTYYSTTGIFGSRPDMWGLRKIQTSTAWDKTTGSDSVIVAVVDTGVDYNHPDLKNQILRDTVGKVIGYDYYNYDADPMDDNGHGTHVAGTIGAVGNNDPNHQTDSGTRVVGVNWKVKIMPVKGIAASGSGPGDALVNSIKFAVDNGAKVINNSWGCDCITSYFDDIINYSYNNGALNVFAAGNSRMDVANASPAGHPLALTVAATNYSDQRACFSNYGFAVDVAAPGGDSSSCGGPDDYILSARSSQSGSWFPPTPTNYYAIARGTSMAAPHAAGLAALVLAAHPDFSIEEVRQILRNSADDVFGADWTKDTGHGRINASKAVSTNLAPPTALIFFPEKDNLTNFAEPGKLTVTGTATSRYGIQKYEVFVGVGTSPSNWMLKATGTLSVQNGTLAQIDVGTLSSNLYSIRLLVTDKNSNNSEDRSFFTYDDELMPGWPKQFASLNTPFASQAIFTDLEGDGKQEIVYAWTEFAVTSQIMVWNIDGSVKPGWPLLVNGYPTHLLVDDLDGDGKKEIVIARFWGGVAGVVYVLKYNGQSYSSVWPKTFSEGSGRYTVATADLNKDGKKEVLVATSDDGRIYAFKLDGSTLAGWGDVKMPGTIENNGYLGGVSVADLDGDGSLEVFIGNPNGNIYAFMANGQQLSGWPQASGSPFVFAPVALADINNDGKKEVIAKGTTCTTAYPLIDTFSVWNYSGKLLWRQSASMNLSGTNGSSAPVVGDVNGDGKKEVIFADVTGLHVFDPTGKELAGWPRSDLMSSQATPSLVDINNDSRPDIATGHNVRSGGSLASGFHITDYQGNTLWQRDYDATYIAPTVGDLDGDGKLEVGGSIDFTNNFFLWKVKNSAVAANSLPWPMYMHDPAHTGEYIAQGGPSDTQPPTVSITSPANGATVSGTVNVAASASDNVGVTKVEFLVDGAVMGEDTTAPYSYSWNTATYSNGLHSLTANAYDAASNFGVSSAVNVTVSNGAGDTQPPTAPTNLTATAVSSSQINLSWTASTDNVGVTGYEVYRSSSKVATVTTTTYGDTGLTPSTTYSYYVKARDAAGNVSASSNTASATTLAQPPDGLGYIKGKVTNSSTGLALAGVKITISGPSRAVTTTNSLGEYTSPGFSLWGTYNVKASLKGYTAQTKSATLTSGVIQIVNFSLVRR